MERTSQRGRGNRQQVPQKVVGAAVRTSGEPFLRHLQSSSQQKMLDAHTLLELMRYLEAHPDDPLREQMIATLYPRVYEPLESYTERAQRIMEQLGRWDPSYPLTALNDAQLTLNQRLLDLGENSIAKQRALDATYNHLAQQVPFRYILDQLGGEHRSLDSWGDNCIPTNYANYWDPLLYGEVNYAPVLHVGHAQRYLSNPVVTPQAFQQEMERFTCQQREVIQLLADQGIAPTDLLPRAQQQILAYRAATNDRVPKGDWGPGRGELSSRLKVRAEDGSIITSAKDLEYNSALQQLGHRKIGRRIPWRKLVAPEAIFLIGNDQQGLHEHELPQWVQRINDGEDSVVVTKDILAAHAPQPVQVHREQLNEYNVRIWRTVDGQEKDTVTVDTRHQNQVQSAFQQHDQWKQQAQEQNAATVAAFQQQLEESWDQTRTAIASSVETWDELMTLQRDARREPVQFNAKSMMEMLAE